MKVIKRVKVIRFKDEYNECSVEGLIHPPNDSTIFNNLKKIVSNKFKEISVELN